MTSEAHEEVLLPELPKAPKVATGPKASELKAKVEAEQHALRRLRMCLRDVCNRILYDKRFSVFHYPVMDEDAPNYRSIIQNPMDMATLLQRVDSGQYITSAAFLQDVDLILANAKVYNGNDYNGSRIVSRAYELRDAVHGMLSQMDPALVAFCEKIAAQGGPMLLPDELGGSACHPNPVVQLATVTRASARLRNVQPDVNLDRSYEALKRQKKNVDTANPASIAEDRSRLQESDTPKSSQDPEANDNKSPERPERSPTDGSHLPETIDEASGHTGFSKLQDDVSMSDGELYNQLESLKQLFVDRSKEYGIPELERLYTRIMKGVFETRGKGVLDEPKPSILRFLQKFAENEANF